MSANSLSGTCAPVAVGTSSIESGLRTVTQLTGIAQPDGETLAAFHRAGERHPSHGSSEHLIAGRLPLTP